MESKRFVRRKEDFSCERCGVKVKGTGYTDHCPNCLYGKHVDVNPGDRMSDCNGLMKPVRAESDRNGFLIIYRCQKCKMEKRMRAAEEDNKEVLMVLLGAL